MTQVIVPSALGGDGLPFSDDGTSPRDMRGQGYAENFVPLMAQAMLALQTGVQAAGAVATASTNTNSTTNLTIGTGAKTLAVETGKALVPGMVVMLANRAAPGNYMVGQVTSYDAGTGALSLNVTVINGAGTYADWVGSVTGLPAQNGLVQRAVTAADTLTVADNGKLIVCSGSFTLAIAALATLGTTWFCYVQNAGAGDVPLDPNAAETIDGIAGFTLYPGALRLVTCDGVALRSIPLVGGTRSFTSTANYVWAPGVNSWLTDVTAGGGGGGGGARSSSRYNGGGGGAGERYRRVIFKSEVAPGASVTCTVGAKGVGGAAAAADNTGGGIGTNGGNSSIGSLVSAVGGKGGGDAFSGGHGTGGQGGGKSVGATNAAAAGQQYPATNTADSEWGGPNGTAGSSAGQNTALLGGQKSGAGGAALAAGANGANSVNPGDAGGGGAGNTNGSTAGKGGDGVDGKIVIVEVI